MDVEEQKRLIYDALFLNWKPKQKSTIKPEVQAIMESFFDKSASTMNIAELNFCVTMCIRHITDYLELMIPDVDLTYAHSMAKKFVLKASGMTTFWKNLAKLGLVDVKSDEMV
jgi:hypothetical protein